MQVEYKIVAIYLPSGISPNRDVRTSEFDLNVLGKDGWELIFAYRAGDVGDSTYGIFKRIAVLPTGGLG